MTCTHSDTFAHGTVQNHLHVQQRHSQRACWGVAYPGPAASTLLRSSSTCYGMQEPCLGTRTGGRPAACSLTPLEACHQAASQALVRVPEPKCPWPCRGALDNRLFCFISICLVHSFFFFFFAKFFAEFQIASKIHVYGLTRGRGGGDRSFSCTQAQEGGQCCCCSTGATVQARCQSLCRAADWKLTSVWEAVLLPGRPCMHTHALRGVLARQGDCGALIYCIARRRVS